MHEKNLKVSERVRRRIKFELTENALFIPRLRGIKGVKDQMRILPTLRNRDLITESEQERLRETVVAIFGMSVGSRVAVTWVMQGRPDKIVISDPDTIDPTNLNRLPLPWSSVGKKKIDVFGKEIIGIHPNIRLISNTDPNPEAATRLIKRNNVNFIVDEVDDLAMKIHLRKLARERKIPLLSAVDVGLNVALDIERYDQKPQPEPFLGRAKKVDLENIDLEALLPQDRMALTLQIVGFEACSEDILDSLLAVGTTLKTWPQLGATATMAGGIVTNTITKIVLSEKVVSGRYTVSLDQILTGKDYNSPTRKRSRKEKIQKIKKRFGMK